MFAAPKVRLSKAHTAHLRTKHAPAAAMDWPQQAEGVHYACRAYVTIQAGRDAAERAAGAACRGQQLSGGVPPYPWAKAVGGRLAVQARVCGVAGPLLACGGVTLNNQRCDAAGM